MKKYFKCSYCYNSLTIKYDSIKDLTIKMFKRGWGINTLNNLTLDYNTEIICPFCMYDWHLSAKLTLKDPKYIKLAEEVKNEKMKNNV
jgi:hypothetical protein